MYLAVYIAMKENLFSSPGFMWKNSSFPRGRECKCTFKNITSNKLTEENYSKNRWKDNGDL